MIIPDINLLLYASISAFPEHDRARSWLEAVINGRSDIGLAAPVIFGFIRLGTNPRVFDPPMSVHDAVFRVEQWLMHSRVHHLLPGPRHLELSFRLLRDLGAAGNLTTDVQLAALAIENQAELHSNDTDFGRFPQLRWVNPLRA